MILSYRSTRSRSFELTAIVAILLFMFASTLGTSPEELLTDTIDMPRTILRHEYGVLFNKKAHLVTSQDYFPVTFAIPIPIFNLEYPHLLTQPNCAIKGYMTHFFDLSPFYSSHLQMTNAKNPTSIGYSILK